MPSYTYKVNNLESDETKSIRIKKGARIILAKESSGTFVPHKYVFDDQFFTEDEADTYVSKLGIEAKDGNPEIAGRVWSSGIHHVFVDGKPARVYVPEETLETTFNDMRSYIERHGSLKMGVDHLQDDFLKDNQILAKMNLLDVGDITDITMDNKGIYIKDSVLTNDAIKALNADGELPMYSIVGAMETKPCPSGKADYVVENLNVERVDIVEEGGCAACSVHAKPEGVIITAKLSKMEAKNMDGNIDKIAELEKQLKELKEAVDKQEEPVEEVVEEVKDEPEAAPVEEVTEEPVLDEPVKEPEEVVEEVSEEQEEPSEDDRVKALEDVIKGLTDKVDKLNNELEGKSSKNVAAKESTFDVDKAIDDLVSEGRASPKMREALFEVGAVSEDAFKKIAASLPKNYRTQVMAKFAKPDKPDEPEEEKPYTETEEFKAMAKKMGYRFE